MGFDKVESRYIASLTHLCDAARKSLISICANLHTF